MEIDLLLLLPIYVLKLLGGAIPPHPIYWLHPWRCCFLKLSDRGTSVPADFLPSLSFISMVTMTLSTVLFPFAIKRKLKSWYLVAEVRRGHKLLGLP